MSTDKFTHYGKVQGGKLELDDRRFFISRLKGFEGGNVCLTLSKVKKNVNLPKHRYYRGVVLVMITQRLNHLGYNMNSDQVHWWLKSRYLYDYVVEENGGELILDPVTKEPIKEVLSTADTQRVGDERMGRFITDCVQFAGESLDLHIPPPTSIN